LVKALEENEPDVLLYTGDIFDDVLPYDNTVALLKALDGKYPAYYVTGNHEYWGYESERALQILRQYGVKPLEGEWESLSVGGQEINICGVDDPDVDFYTNPERPFAEQLESLKDVANNGNYTILLSHRPERIGEYANYPFDLVVAGHAHGGQWRIPGILNGLIAPNQGLFPKYAGGEYLVNDTTLIVSRGLARESTKVPRVHNPPELVIVELSGGS
jgi:predicted MPP superfamily phosphohydrolase